MNELERIWKEAAVAYFKVLFRQMPGGIEENHEHIVRIVSLRLEI
jgi:hypothetical protein